MLAGDPTAKGVVGDLGGSSLELIRLNGSAPADGVSLPLGPFALGAPRPLAIDRTRRIIEAALAPHADRFAGRDFHAVGGAWRNIALLHMELAGYPLGRWLAKEDAERGGPGKLYIVARPQNNPYIAAHFEKLRESNGNEQIDRGRAGTRMLTGAGELTVEPASSHGVHLHISRYHFP